jgi:hypothetical protein
MKAGDLMRFTAWVVAVLSGIYGVRWSIIIVKYSPPAYVRYALIGFAICGVSVTIALMSSRAVWVR